MCDIAFISFFPDLYGIEKPRFAMSSQQASWVKVELVDLKQEGVRYVTINAARFIDEFRSAKLPLPKIIDVQATLRLIVGLSRDQGGEAKWNVWNALLPFSDDVGKTLLFRDIFEGQKQASNDKHAYELLGHNIQVLSRLWTWLQIKLIDHGEAKRFWDVEVGVQDVIFHRQIAGIRIHNDTLNSLINETNEKKYKAYLKVADALGQSPSGLSFRNIGSLIERTDARHLGEFSRSANFESYMKLAVGSSAFAEYFVDMIRWDRDYKILVQMTEGEDRVFPTFFTMGTVTGRVLIKHPYIQELRKENRHVIQADWGKKLAYLDYAQFEPGIFADLAQDNELTSMYNGKDLYGLLGKALFGDTSHRNVAKRIFLAFCYGMSPENITKLLQGTTQGETSNIEMEGKVKQFFEQFPALDRYRQKLHSDLRQNGTLASLLGNNRHRSETGKLTFKEQRWAVSQAVQGTASLIFKEALINVASEFGYDSIVLPMHDAILIQFDDDKHYDSKVGQAQKLMENVFSRRCPSIRGRVEASSFAPVE
jgi:DNA polymerase-1